MDKKKIIIGVSALAVLGIVYFIISKKKGNKNTSVTGPEKQAAVDKLEEAIRKAYSDFCIKVQNQAAFQQTCTQQGINELTFRKMQTISSDLRLMTPEDINFFSSLLPRAIGIPILSIPDLSYSEYEKLRTIIDKYPSFDFK